eukprot:206906-Pelagomonas_calceolata.AAC.1
MSVGLTVVRAQLEGVLQAKHQLLVCGVWYIENPFHKPGRKESGVPVQLCCSTAGGRAAPRLQQSGGFALSCMTQQWVHQVVPYGRAAVCDPLLLVLSSVY